MSKKIDLNWSVYDITKTYPEVIDIMANLGFDEIKKPAMLNSVGRIMTIPFAFAPLFLRVQRQKEFRFRLL